MHTEKYLSSMPVHYASMFMVSFCGPVWVPQNTVNLPYNFFFNSYSGDGVQVGPLGTAATNRPIVPAPGDYDDGEIGGMIGRGNRSTLRKPASVPLCPPQTPHAARTRTQATAVGSQWLTAWAAAQPSIHIMKFRRPILKFFFWVHGWYSRYKCTAF
jgi:hypothetical protein